MDREMEVMGYHYGPNIGVPSKFICENPNPQCDDIRRGGLWGWPGHEGGTLKTLIKENPESSLAPFFVLWGNSKKTAMNQE